MSNGDDIVDVVDDDAAPEVAAAASVSGLCRPALHNFLTALLLVAALATPLGFPVLNDTL